VRIEVRVEPAERAGEVTSYVFFADGREVCRVEAPRPAVCQWDAGSVVRAHQLRAVASLADRRRLVATRRTRALDVVASADVRVVQVPAVVTDRGGTFVRGLTRDAFAVSEDGVPQAIQHFSSEDAPLELVLALDVSASMAAALPELRHAVGEFARRLPLRATVAMMAFNDEMFPVGQPTDTLDRRLEILERLQPFGGTALYDVMIRGLDDLARRSGRRALIVFTDGDDQSSRATRDQVRGAAEASDVTVYFVALGRGRDVDELLESMDGLATLSGGRALHAERSAQLGERFGAVLSELPSQYLIGYAPTNDKRDGVWRKIEVRLRRPDLRIRARLGYRAPSR
jgi:Ca-activated chloride channel family protein